MRRVRVSVGAALLALVLSGCGSVSEEYEVTGIDQLDIPTPSPDPDDFVATIDNPWLPLEPGHVWTYDVGGETSGTTVVAVADRSETVAGVEVTVVETRMAEQSPGVEVTARRTDYFAQDREGNVWWFGTEGVWEAGLDGAEAGLAMPADPRVGDGWRLALSDGVVEDRATVESIEEGQVIVRVESDLTPDVVELRSYDAGVGLVRTVNVDGPRGSSELQSGP